MSNYVEYKDVVAIHPGYYVEEIIESMNISQEEFAVRMGTTAKTVSKLVNNQINLSNDLAAKLSSLTGTSVELWLNLQIEYDEQMLKIRQYKELDDQREIMKLIDYSYFIKHMGLPSTNNMLERIRNLCKFLKVSNLKILAESDLLVNFRSASVNVSLKHIVNSRVWLQTAINASEYVSVKQFDPKKLNKYIPRIREMTVENPEVFLPELKKMFAECGVCFVLLPYLKNSVVYGAVKWITNDKVLLAMNNRGLNADIFWFSLFHEIKHVLQKKTKTVFISSSTKELIAMNEQLEQEADAYASEVLIPSNILSKWSPDKYVTDEEIVEFAESIDIHPGIVAGRLQHDGIIPQNRCSELKEKYVIETVS